MKLIPKKHDSYLQSRDKQRLCLTLLIQNWKSQNIAHNSPASLNESYIHINIPLFYPIAKLNWNCSVNFCPSLGVRCTYRLQVWLLQWRRGNTDRYQVEQFAVKSRKKWKKKWKCARWTRSVWRIQRWRRCRHYTTYASATTPLHIYILGSVVTAIAALHATTLFTSSKAKRNYLFSDERNDDINQRFWWICMRTCSGHCSIPSFAHKVLIEFLSAGVLYVRVCLCVCACVFARDHMLASK